MDAARQVRTTHPIKWWINEYSPRLFCLLCCCHTNTNCKKNFKYFKLVTSYRSYHPKEFLYYFIDAPELTRVPKELIPKPCSNSHECVLPRASSQDRADILSVLANEIFSWTSLDKQEEARIPETHYPHGVFIPTLPFLLLFLAFIYIIEERYLVALNSPPVNRRKNW